jgi:hypothetical protein
MRRHCDALLSWNPRSGIHKPLSDLRKTSFCVLLRAALFPFRSEVRKLKRRALRQWGVDRRGGCRPYASCLCNGRPIKPSRGWTASASFKLAALKSQAPFDGAPFGPPAEA